MPTAPVLSIVVPAYQEGAGLAQALRAIADAARETALPFELIVVDDGSNDATWDAIVTVGSRAEEVIGIRLSRNFGKEGAIAAGLDLVRGDACIVMDADLQHPPSLIPELVRRSR